jgi:NADPH:quinone reductase-like Zn-dependent oxidoreductase
MKAMVYRRNENKFTMSEVPSPEPAKGEVLVRVHASSINAADYRSLKLGIRAENGIYGADVAGTVVKLGEGVTRLAVGDAVQGDLAMEGFGGFGECTTGPEELFSKIPSGVSFETAAATTLAGVTALQAFRLASMDLRGKRVLIIGASGGVGTFAVQLAKYYGAEVTGVTSARNLEQARAIGAERVIDYHREDALASGAQYDLILGVQGNTSPRAYKRALNKGGAAIVVGGALNQVFKILVFGWLYSIGGKRVAMLAAKPNAKDTEELMRLVAAGTIRPVIEKVVPLEELDEAFRYVASGHASVKVVVKVI